MIISRSALLPYSAEKMYAVVADIDSYPEFLNWCSSTQIISHTPEEVIAKMVISYTKLNIDFTTRNINSPGELIKMSLVEGPFSTLQGEWAFQALSEDACKVSINMQFDFERSLTKRMMAKVFTKVISAQFDAFMTRAKQLYGDHSAAN